ncbi:LemA family protein [Eubacterium oxidoreducens]|uniref:LemA protein n=1 Tax=Eubacterium oxidoreducens TaxID=1732 RepID=A0A1G6BCE9_EUBOX|nr:LemA family protein [Eubacterium oxidoreducens]SDB18256.1 LemA protein [Eubacterium oxidoreducens]
MGFIIGIIVIVVIVIILAGWIISTQRTLVRLDENINNAKSQIGVQMSSRFDALTALAELTQSYDAHEAQTLLQTINARRTGINAQSTAAEINAQEQAFTKALGQINVLAERYPDLKANQNYAKAMDSVNQYENMVRNSRLIYNDSVTKLNRMIRMWPASMIAGRLGFDKREYLEEDQNKTDMPSMKLH